MFDLKKSNMASLSDMYELETSIIHKTTSLQANVTITTNNKFQKWTIYLLDKKFNKFCLAGSYLWNDNEDNNYSDGINSKIFYDKNICLFHKWLFYNNNIKFILYIDENDVMKYNQTEFKFAENEVSCIDDDDDDDDAVNINYDQFPNIHHLKDFQIQQQAWKIIQIFRLNLRQKIRILFTQLPFIPLQYLNFINHHLQHASNIFLKLIKNDISQIIEWFNSNKNEVSGRLGNSVMAPTPPAA